MPLLPVVRNPHRQLARPIPASCGAVPEFNVTVAQFMDKMSALRQYFTGKLHIDQPLLMEARAQGQGSAPSVLGSKRHTCMLRSAAGLPQLMMHCTPYGTVHAAPPWTRNVLLLPTLLPGREGSTSCPQTATVSEQAAATPAVPQHTVWFGTASTVSIALSAIPLLPRRPAGVTLARTPQQVGGAVSGCIWSQPHGVWLTG